MSDNITRYNAIRQRIATHEMRITKLQKTLEFLVVEHKELLNKYYKLQEKYRFHLDHLHRRRLK